LTSDLIPQLRSRLATKALLIYYEDYPWDVRVEKFLGALADCCDQVHLVARNRQRRPIREKADLAVYHRLRPLSSNGMWSSLLDSPAFFNPRWFRRIGEVTRETNPDVLIVRDLPLAIAAHYWAKRARIPVILDMAEDYPAMFSAYRPWESFRERSLNLVLRNESIARLVEIVSVRWMDHILVVTEEQRDRLVRSGVAINKISIVGNTPLAPMHGINHYNNPSAALKVIYVGEVHHMRGLDTAIRAMGRLAREMPPIQLRVLGTGKTESKLRELAKQMAPDNVIFEGWVDPKRIPEELQRSDVGLIPHYRSRFTDTTLPNKLFDYMAAGIPVLASDAEPLKRIINETRCGVVFGSADEKSMAEALMTLRDPDLRRRLGANGRRAVETRYNWNVDAKILQQVIAKCIGTRDQC
jgi:glycosyltransferase involved in cell wall biosynthesis